MLYHQFAVTFAICFQQAIGIDNSTNTPPLQAPAIPSLQALAPPSLQAPALPSLQAPALPSLQAPALQSQQVQWPSLANPAVQQQSQPQQQQLQKQQQQSQQQLSNQIEIDGHNVKDSGAMAGEEAADTAMMMSDMFNNGVKGAGHSFKSFFHGMGF